MKNKEIEELLNELKRRNERYNYCKNNDISFSDEDYNSHLLLSYIEQLENNRDKAIEIIKKDWYKLNSRNINEFSNSKTDIRITLYNILKGESNE